MDRQRHARASELFVKASELKPADRRVFLDEACGEDTELRVEIESLLAFNKPAAEILGTDVISPQAHGVVPGLIGEDGTDLISTHVGPYKVIGHLSTGGMGEVYEAQQEEPVRRKVALKLIKWGMDSKAVIGRFEAERQALALMSHPNVARVFDAGATEKGRPYFAMELVRGVPITEHCDRQRLTTGERLELFLQVCEGVQHAHQKGIIHRDIKPSNILVQIEGKHSTPKIIDFGVAKATAQRITEHTVLTELGQIIGTPEYMSPEQAEMTVEDIDTRSDVYSLGVLLYELLVGALPFARLREGTFEDIRRRLREEEPSKPSIRVSTLGDASTESSRKRRTDPRSLAKELRGDLDWITMKALEKDRTRRYGSPVELAADITRHLRHQPVLAGPPGATYRMAKFVRRHRIGVTVATALVVFLAGFAARERIQSQRISEERDRANQEADAANRTSQFLSNMLGGVDPERMGTALMVDVKERVAQASRSRGASDKEVEKTSARFEESMRGVNATDAALRLIDREILERAAQTIERELGDDPLYASRLLHAIGKTYRELGLYERAESHSQQAMEIRARVLGEDDPATLESMSDLATLYDQQGRYDEAETLYIKAFEARRRVLGPEHPETLHSMHNLAAVYAHQGRYDEAETLSVTTLETRRRVLGPEHPETLRSSSNLAGLYSDQGRYDEAETLYVKTLDARRKVLGDAHSETLVSIHNLASLYADQGRYDVAEPLYLETIESLRHVYGTAHPRTLSAMGSLAILYARQSRYDTAQPLFLEIANTRKRVLGARHPETLSSMSNLAIVYKNVGRYAEAERLYLEVLTTLRRDLGPDHPRTVRSSVNLANLYTKQRRYDEAEALYLENLATLRRTRGDDHPDTLGSMLNLAVLYEGLKRYEQAELVYTQVLDRKKRLFGGDHPGTIDAMYNLGNLYLAQGRYDEAEILYLESLEKKKRALGEHNPSTLDCANNLGIVYLRQGRYDEAEALHLETLQKRRDVFGDDHAQTLDSILSIASVAAVRGDRERALDFLRRTIKGDYWSSADEILDEQDLSSLHGDPEFEAIVAEVKKRVEDG